MQIKRVKSITPKSEYFQEILLSDGKNTFYNSKNRVFIHDGKQTMTFPIKKSYYCLFIDGFAYVVNEHGSLYCINLKDQHCTVLQKNFGVDCNYIGYLIINCWFRQNIMNFIEKLILSIIPMLRKFVANRNIVGIY